MIWQRLLWKDYVTIRPLLLAIGLAIVAMPLLIVSFAITGDDRGLGVVGLSLMLWILLPNLVAIGAPALLVGTEEESGTLGWLRTLPVRWQPIADSKLVVGLAAVVGAWGLASLALACCTWAWPVWAMTGPDVAGDVLGPINIANSFFFSLLLLICGFVCAYALKSPVAGLVALLPLITGLYFSVSAGIHWILDDPYGKSLSAIDASMSKWLLVVVVCGLVMGALIALSRVLACRRLMTAERSFRNPVGGINRGDAYRPPPVPVVGLYQPSAWYALLWQQWRQVRVVVCSLVVIALVCAGLGRASTWNDGNGMIGYAVPIVVTVFLWLGAITFYGDSVRRQCGFFADRGIARTGVWWTRVIPTLVPAVILVAFIVVVAIPNGRYGQMHEYRMSTAVLLMTSYAFGQLVSMWVKRPALAYFAAPAWAVTAAWCWSSFYIAYLSYIATALLLTPILLLTTWRMMGRWLDDRIDRGFHWRVVAWTALAIAVPMASVLSIRWATTPPKMTAWRSRMLAIDGPLPTRTGNRWGLQPYSRLVSTEAMAPSLSADVGIRENIEERLRQELTDEEAIGRHVSFSELRQLIQQASADSAVELVGDESSRMTAVEQSGDAKMDADADAELAKRILAKWAMRVRQLVIAGEEGLPGLIKIAAPAERLLGEVPDQDLRRKSRRAAVISEWRMFQQKPWRAEYDHVYSKTFAGEYLLQNPAIPFAIERNRVDRQIDWVTRELLEQIDSGILPLGRNQLAQWRHHWFDAVRGPYVDQLSLDRVPNDFADWVEGL